jgi:hypothetical protein
MYHRLGKEIGRITIGESKSFVGVTDMSKRAVICGQKEMNTAYCFMWDVSH